MKQLVYLDQAFVAKNSKKKFNLNDIVTVHTGEVGTSALITEEYVGSIGFTTLRSRIRDMKKVYPAYLCHYLNSHRCKEAIASKTISDRNNLNQGAFAELTIPLPPLAEQRRIVAILDRFDSLCNSLTEGLPAEIALRKKQYEYYRDKLLSFKEAS
jgi:type I restriction enzyme S subunit